jgi:predicted CXXCH cytochrome family protein
MRKLIVLFLISAFTFCFSVLILKNCFAESIVNSKHNLSSSGQGKVKSVAESEICIFCHTPHNASSSAPLWNRYESGQVYTPYTSTTLKTTTGQPTGASKLCLSCHDGTVALGMLRSRSQVIPFTQPIGGEQNLGTDLSDDHPISFRYDTALVFSNQELKDPSLLTSQIRLDKDSQLQCTSCHDPHNNQFGYFSRVNGVRGNLCLACHSMDGWNESLHKNSTSSWNGVSPNPWTHTLWNNVADNACENCHTPHNAAGKKRLLNSSTEEGICIPCHNGNVTQKNIVAEFNKPSIHPIYNYTGLHDPAENVMVTSNRHVECLDCHNSHAVSDSPTGTVPGSLRKTKGVNAQGSAVDAITYEYELCFRCHADSNFAARTHVNRQFVENNTRIEFDPANQSFHPIENIGKNANVPSLITPLTASSILKCSDCHNNNTGPGNGGTGPKGPHGSIYSPLLERNLSFADNQAESLSAYALCYKCHDRNNILGNRSFPEHQKHISEEKTPCTTCHDPHGVKNAPHLINFDRNIVSANSSGQLSFTDNGFFHGSCSLNCHNEQHNNMSY